MLSDEEVRALYERHGHAIYRRCRRLLGEREARDAVQDVFCLALHYRSTFRRGAPPLHWLHRVTTTHCLRRLRQRKNAPIYAEAPGEDTLESAGEDPMETLARRRLVLELLEHFDEKTQAIAICTFVEGFLQDETAEIMGMSSRAVRKRLEAFREKAKKLAERSAR